MRSKQTFTGGEPNMNLDDILRDVVAIRSAFHDIMKGYNNGLPIILSGCDVTGGTMGSPATVTAGYIYIGGRVVEVEAQTVADSLGSATFKYVVSTTYESGGNKVYINGISRQTWKRELGIVTNVLAGTLNPTTDLSITGSRVRIMNHASVYPLANNNLFVKCNNSNVITFSEVLIDNGDVSSADHSWGMGGDLTADGNWHDLDLTGKVSTGAKWVLLRIRTSGTAGSLLSFRQNGLTNEYNTASLIMPASTNLYADLWVRMDSDRIIEYKIAATMSSGSMVIGGEI